MNGRRNLQPFKDFGEFGRDDRTLGQKWTYGLYSMILGAIVAFGLAMVYEVDSSGGATGAARAT